MNKEQEDWFADWIRSREWTFAKTYAETAPHEYTVRKDEDEDFLTAVALIRKNGYQEYYWKNLMTYMDFDGMKYWTMGAPVEDTIIINRARLDCPIDAERREHQSSYGMTLSP